MSDPRLAEEGKAEGMTDGEDVGEEGKEEGIKDGEDVKKEENDKDEGENRDLTPDTDTTALIEKIAEQFSGPEEESKDESEAESSDEEVTATVEVEEVEVETVIDDTHFTARVERIAKQAEYVFNEKGDRKDTLFYKIVLAGNVRVVSHVLDSFDAKGKVDVVNWLLMKGKRQRLMEIPVKSVFILQCVQGLMFLLFSLISFLCSPVFYVLHEFTTSINSRQKHRIAANISLPLAFSAFSQDEDMMKFFLSKGVNIKTSDREGNNVFHYIADLSSECTSRAMEIFTCLVKFINDRDIVKLLIGEKRNSAGLTALEYAARYGSPQLLTQMLNHPGLIQHTAFAAGKEDVSFGQTETEEDRNEQVFEAITKLEYVDVTMYEAGRFTRLSTLLNFLSDRAVTDMSKEDLDLFHKMAFVGKWITLKTKQMFVGIFWFHAGDIIVTIVLIVLLINGLGSDNFSARESDGELRVMLMEIKAQGQNKSYIFKDESLQRIIRNVQYQMQRNFLYDKVGDQKAALFIAATARYPEVKEFYNASLENFYIHLNDTPAAMVDKLFDSAQHIPRLRERWPTFDIWRFLPEIIGSYSRKLFETQPHLDGTEVTIANREFIQSEIEEYFHEFNVTVEGTVISPSDSIEFWEFQNLFCVRKALFNLEDLKQTDMIAPPPDIYYSSCSYQTLMELANEQCEMQSADDTYDKVKKIMNGILVGNTAEIVFQLIVVIACCYIVLDIFERMVFLYTCVANHSNAYDMVLSVFSKKVPGSYTRKQINMITYLSFIARYITFQNGLQMSKAYGWTTDEVREFGNLFLVIGLVFRFVMHIHSMRLLPGIGHFVITTFMMGTNLIHFSAVYGAVLFIFSIIFHILIDDPACPLRKYDGFDSILTSMFSVFKLTFGHGEFDGYYTSTPVMLTYTLYVVIVGLLLMNLIIAIMSSTATDIMTEPWKETLWRVEWLEEALSVEFTINIFGQLVHTCYDSGLWTHKKAGFMVIKVGKDSIAYRVFIEVFRCHALERD